MALPLFTPGAFSLADRQLCERIAAELYGLGDDDVAAGKWSDLAARIQRILVGEYTRITSHDVQLVQRRHIDVLRSPLEAGARERSRSLSRLGVLVLEASRGRLPQLEGAAGAQDGAR